MPLKAAQAPNATVADGSITTAKLADNAITADKLADNAVDAGAIATGAVTTGKLGSGAVDATALASGAVTSAKIAADTVGVPVEERQMASATTTSGDEMGAAGLGFTPAANSAVAVLINGLSDYTPSFGAKTGDYYWSADGGTTARASQAALVAGDKVYAGSKSGSYCAGLATDDEITFKYSKSLT